MEYYPTANDDRQQAALLLPYELEQVRRFLFSYSKERGHRGRFAVLLDPQPSCLEETNGSQQRFSLPANLPFSMDRPLTYLRNVLSSPLKSAFQRNNNDRDELVVFLPGPAAHALENQAQTTPGEQLQYLSQVLLEGMPMSLLQVGTHADHEDSHETFITVKLGPETIQAMQSLDLITGPLGVELNMAADDGDEGLYRVRARDLDILQAFVAADITQGDDNYEEDDPLLDALVKLIDIAVESVREETQEEEPHLVLFTTSTTSLLVSAAIAKWKRVVVASSSLPATRRLVRNNGLDDENEAERLLHQAVTVVTVAALCQFPAGPAYVHISMYDDPLAAEFGVAQKDPSSGGGKGAVVLQAVSPYTTNSDDKGMDMLYANDSHNINACAIQFLSLVLRINGLTSFRELYNAGSRPTAESDIKPSLFALKYDDTVGVLEMPQDELLLSIIKATGAERWLWRSLIKDDDDEALPDNENAEAIVIEHFGYGVYEDVTEACCGGRPLPCSSESAAGG